MQPKIKKPSASKIKTKKYIKTKSLSLKKSKTTKQKAKYRTTKNKTLTNTLVSNASVPAITQPETEDDLIINKTVYLSNKELLAEVKRAKTKREMTNKLAQMLQLLCAKYAKKGNFINYSYNDDMQAYAMMMLVRTWDSFDPEKSDNPFAFFTQCIKNSFIQYLNQEKRQRNVRDLLLVNQGLTPSFTFSEDGPEQHIVDDEEDFNSTQHLFKQIKAIQIEDVDREPLTEEHKENATM